VNKMEYDKEGVPVGIDENRYMNCVIVFGMILQSFTSAKTFEERREVLDAMLIYLLSEEGRYFMRMCPPSLQASIRNKLAEFMEEGKAGPNLQRVWNMYFV
jgi:hypothetical protein